VLSVSLVRKNGSLTPLSGRPVDIVQVMGSYLEPVVLGELNYISERNAYFMSVQVDQGLLLVEVYAGNKRNMLLKFFLNPAFLQLIVSICVIIGAYFSVKASLGSYLKHKYDPIFDAVNNDLAKCISEDLNYSIPMEYTIDELNEFAGNINLLISTIKNQNARVLKESNELKNRAEAKNSFLSHMSHEIRTPLNGVLGFLQLAQDPHATEDEREDALRNSMISANALLELINNILNTAKMEAGAITLEKIPFDMNEVLEITKLTNESTAENKGLSFFINKELISGKRLIGDPTHLRIILNNLVSNAIKFTDSGNVTLLVRMEEGSGSNMSLYFLVKDQGAGMTPEQLEKVFDKFTQADASTTRKAGGTGLGLPMAKNLIELMGGLLEVSSTPYVGTSFTFKLTFPSVHANIVKPDEVASRPIKNWNGEVPNFDGEALIVEDVEMNQKLLQRMLARVGVSSIVANNGKESLRIHNERLKAKEPMFDIIFMDINMPIMDGRDATERLRSIGYQGPIVMATANQERESENVFRKHGFTNVISKPIYTDELYTILDEYLQRSILKKAQVSTAEDIPTILDIKYSKDDPELLDDFLSSANLAYREFLLARKREDFKVMHRLSHSIKGLSGYINCDSLITVANDVELSLAKQPPEVNNAKIDLFVDTLKRLIEMLGGLSGTTSVKLTSRQKETLQMIRNYADQDSLSATEFLSELKTIPGTDTVYTALDDFDLKKAVAEINLLLGDD